ncbi:flp pilus-assembly TadE/G-like family protein [Arcanobacterium phocae]|uniref:Helicase/secretion neighborhood TadE-like protein n=1 Tax=Arcanobacterium phocae TaxID=131112 RepID=A0A1H2LCN2_9ACTO|nr:flp pilus-assembly TadE/G-like family protein [Arcanobacterium phocae]SDU78777.1 helicase/secretion neighborhood TadE-like protein [Arcanobacterium phocae]
MTNSKEHITEVGSTTVLMIGVIAILLALGGVLTGLGWAGERQQDIQDVTDLAALSAAQVYRETSDSQRACQVASQLAAGMDLSCSVAGAKVSILATSHPQLGWIRLDFHAKATAGPRYEIDPALLP